MTLTLIPAMIMGYQWLIILLIVLLLFGGKKIPELMKGVGKGVKAFKDGMNEVEKEMNSPVKNEINKEQSTKDQNAK